MFNVVFLKDNVKLIIIIIIIIYVYK